jgi:hypothetical protein
MFCRIQMLDEAEERPASLRTSADDVEKDEEEG